MSKINSRPHAPYTRVEPVLNVIHRYRERGLPDPVTSQSLDGAGIVKNNGYQTIQALTFLRLIDEEGHPTEAFDRIRDATTAEYPSVLSDIVHIAYQPVFAVVNPSEDDPVRVADAFRQYDPAGQRERMVWLFMALCREAEIISEVKVRKPTIGPKSRATTNRINDRNSASSSNRRSAPVLHTDAVGEVKPSTLLTPLHTQQPHTTEELSGLAAAPENPQSRYQLIVALVDQLPKDGRWTTQRRDRWLQAVEATVDLLVETIPDGKEEEIGERRG